MSMPMSPSISSMVSLNLLESQAPKRRLLNDLPDLCLLTTFDHLPLYALFCTVPLVSTRWHQLQSPALARRRRLVLMENCHLDSSPNTIGDIDLQSAHQRARSRRFDSHLDRLYQQQFPLHHHEWLQNSDQNKRPISRQAIADSILQLRTNQASIVLPDEAIEWISTRMMNLTSLAVVLREVVCAFPEPLQKQQRNLESFYESLATQQISQLERLLLQVGGNGGQKGLRSLTIRLKGLGQNHLNRLITTLNQLNTKHLTFLDLGSTLGYIVPETRLSARLLYGLERLAFKPKVNLEPWLMRSFRHSKDLQHLPLIDHLCYKSMTSLKQNTSTVLVERAVNLEVSMKEETVDSLLSAQYQLLTERLSSCRTLSLVGCNGLPFLSLVRWLAPLRHQLEILSLVNYRLDSAVALPSPATGELNHNIIQPLEAVRTLYLDISSSLEHHDHLFGVVLPHLDRYLPRLQALHLVMNGVNTVSNQCEHCSKSSRKPLTFLGTERVNWDTTDTAEEQQANNPCLEAFLEQAWLNTPVSLQKIVYNNWQVFTRPW